MLDRTKKGQVSSTGLRPQSNEGRNLEAKEIIRTIARSERLAPDYAGFLTVSAVFYPYRNRLTVDEFDMLDVYGSKRSKPDKISIPHGINRFAFVAHKAAEFSSILGEIADTSGSDWPVISGSPLNYLNDAERWAPQAPWVNLRMLETEDTIFLTNIIGRIKEFREDK